MQSWQLLSASKLNVTVHQARSSDPFFQYNPHRGIINAAVYNHTNKVIATCGQDSRIDLRSATKQEHKLLDLTFHSITEEPTSVNCLHFSNKSKYIAAGAANGLIKVWDMKAHKDVYQKLKGHASAITSLAWVGNETAIASSSIGGDIHIHRVSTGKLDTLASRIQDGYNNIKVSEGQGFSRLAACTVSGSIMIWDLNATTKRPTYVYEDPEKTQITCLSISSFQPALLAASSLNSNLSFFDINQKKTIKTISALQPLTAVSFHHNGHTIAVGGINGGLWVYDLRKPNQNISHLIGHETSVKSVCFSTNPQKQKDRQSEKQIRQKQSRPSNIHPSYKQSRLRQPKETNTVTNKSNPHAHMTNNLQKEMQSKNLTANPSVSKITPLQEKQDKYVNSRIIKSKKQQLNPIKPIIKQQNISLNQVDIANQRFIKPTMNLVPSTLAPSQSINNKDIKILEQKLQSQQTQIKQIREQMHDRFDTLHLQIIRQMQLYMKTMMSKIEQSNNQKQELKNQIKKLQAENQNLRKRTY